MVLDDDIDDVLVGKLAEPVQTIRRELLLFFVFAAALGVDPNGMATEFLGRNHPLVMVLDGLLALALVGITKRTFAIAHNQQAAHALIGTALLQLGDVLPIFGLVLPERVDVLDRIDTERLGLLRKVEVAQLLAKQRLVQRPFGQTDLE